MQAVLDQPADNRMIRVQRIATAGIVCVPKLRSLKQVVSPVLEAAETQRRTVIIALRPCG